MTTNTSALASIAAGALMASGLLGAGAIAQSARDVRGPSPYITIENEPAARLIVDPPLPGPLAKGLVQIQYRTENVRIVPVFGENARNVSPRIGHLHIRVDDLPWHWADASDSNTVDIVGLPPGPHKVRIELVGADHRPLDVQIVTFAIPDAKRHEHSPSPSSN